MAPLTNGQLLFNSVPTGMFTIGLRLACCDSSNQCFFHHLGYPEPGKTTVYDTTETIDLETVVLNGGILIKTLELSIDPYMRGRMRAPEAKSYSVSGEKFWVITLRTSDYKF